MKSKISCLLFFCALGFTVSAQQIMTGRVVDLRTGLPVTGATVRLLANKTAVVTDDAGSFRIAWLSLPDTLAVSAVGFEPQRLYVKTALPVVIRLREVTTSLQEVVVSTGYQSVPAERATGSFAFVGGSMLNEQVGTDVISRLEGVTGGLFFNRTTGAAPQIEVRGLSTINGPSAPLIVVDNFPYEGDIANINPNDVESITVLKDAAAASIWGTRAGNGVIVITTKKARFNQPLTVEWNADMVMNERPDLGYLPQMRATDFIDVEQMLFSKGFYDNRINDPAHPALTPVVELLSAERNGSLSAASANAAIGAFRSLDVRNDLNKYFYGRSVNQQYALSLHGGSEMQSWLFSGGYDKDVSSLQAGYDRVNLHFRDGFKPGKNLAVGTSLYYTQSLSVPGKPGYGDISLYNGAALYPYARLADAGGNALPVAKDYSLSYVSGLPPSLLDWRYYPLTDYRNVSARTILQDMVASGNISYKFFSFLKFNALYQYERQSTDTRNDEGLGSYAVRNLVNEFTHVDASGNVTNVVPVGDILNVGDQLVESHNLRGQLDMNRAWGANEINAIAGGELRQVNTTGDGNSFYGYNPNTLTFGNVDLTSTYPLYATGAPAFVPDTKSLTDLRNRFVSLFANAAYTLDGCYTFSVSGRRDASNLFGVNTNNKWNPLGSAGLAWEVSREGFYKVAWLPYARLRATYGLSGNADLSQTAVSTISYLNNSPYSGGPQAVFNTYANPELKWETVAMLNLALDFRAFNSRLSGTVEYYHKKASGLFGQTPVDYTTGISFYIVKNVAAMSGNGLDITLNSLNTNGKFKWNTVLNFSVYHDKITAYYLGNQPAGEYVGVLPLVSGVVGRPVYSVFSYPWAGLDPLNGNPRGYVNGQVSENYDAIYNNTTLSQLKYHGSALPTQFGSLANDFRYGNISLEVNLMFKLGYYFRRKSVDYGQLFNNGYGNPDFALRWQNPGDELHTNVPSMVYPDVVTRDAFYNGSSPLVERADHVRLQYITAGYDLLKSRFPGLPFKMLRLYANVSNIGIIWRANKEHIDPDYYYGRYSLKPPVTIAFGVKTSF